MTYDFIQRVKRAFPVQRACQVLQVSRAGFYDWLGRDRSPQDPELVSQLKSVFAESQRCYGSRTTQRALNRRGIKIGRYRVRRLMRQLGLRSVWRRRSIRTTDSRHGFAVADNLLARQFDVAAPDQVWVADMTYIQTRQGWVFLAAVMDLYARRIVGWAMAKHMESSVVIRAMQMALHSRRPPAGLMLHTDRGGQYASHAHVALLEKHGVVRSMSRPRECEDNAVMERFFLSLKTERVWRRDYATRVEAEQDVHDYILRFYNTQRLHSKLGYCPPAEYERVFAEKTYLAV